MKLPAEGQSGETEVLAQPEGAKKRPAIIVSNSVFVETVRKNYSLYLAKCYAYVHCSNMAEDAVQEGVLAAHNNLPSLQNEAALEGWLYRIIVRKAIDLLHKTRKQPTFHEDMEELVNYDKNGFLVAPVWAEVSDPEQEVLKQEGLEKVNTALNSLSDEYRIPLLLKDFEGFSTKEVAEILNLTTSNTKVRVHRARIKLREQLNSYFFPDYLGGEQ
ncbi:MAG: RNA polymerase sigma factor [Gammaproteobacteria bacterium]|nr:RNA polymerase sigma factor [Gammaproteobacteria bacterium]